MKSRTVAAAVLIACSMTALAAEELKTGPHGGRQAHAGEYHVELVPQGATLQVFLRDHDNKAVPSSGFKGTAIFVVDGKAQRIPLAPAGENKLAGTASVALPDTPKGAVQITTSNGKTLQAKFN